MSGGGRVRIATYGRARVGARGCRGARAGVFGEVFLGWEWGVARGCAFGPGNGRGRLNREAAKNAKGV